MNAKKLAIGAGRAGAGIFVARSLGPKLHEHCQACVRPASAAAPMSAETTAAICRKTLIAIGSSRADACIDFLMFRRAWGAKPSA